MNPGPRWCWPVKQRHMAKDRTRYTLCHVWADTRQPEIPPHARQRPGDTFFLPCMRWRHTAEPLPCMVGQYTRQRISAIVICVVCSLPCIGVRQTVYCGHFNVYRVKCTHGRGLFSGSVRCGSTTARSCHPYVLVKMLYIDRLTSNVFFPNNIFKGSNLHVNLANFMIDMEYLS
jgi:hypothetical protein